MAAMSSEGAGVIYAIAVVGSCTGEAKTGDLKCVFYSCPPRKIKGAPEDRAPECTSYIFAILLARFSKY